VPNVTERLTPSAPRPPIAEQPVAAPAVQEVKAPAAAAVDGVEAKAPVAPDAAPAEPAAAPRKAIAQRLGTLTKRVLQGAAIAGLAASLIVGGNFVLSRMNGTIPPKPATPIEAPIDIHDPALPGQGPPSSEIVPADPGTSTGGGQVHAPSLPGAGGAPTLPSGQPGTLPQLNPDQVKPQGPITFNPQTIRIPR